MSDYLKSNSDSSGAMLAGVCSRLANWLGWNVWAIRAVLLILLIAKPLVAAVGYAAAALLLAALDRSGKAFKPRSAESDGRTEPLQSPELADRKRRIDDLEQRFRNWEKSLPKD